jgi:UDP-glucose 4-epimerase
LAEKILVTGGAGYVGSVCVANLIHRGYKVTVYDNLSTGHSRAVPDGALLEIGDLGQVDALSRVMASFRPDFVMHFAASCLLGESMKEPLKYYTNNVRNGQTLIEVMLRHDVKGLIFSSSCAIFGEPKQIPMTEDDPKVPMNPYGKSKLAFEYLLDDCDAAYGLKSVCLRYFNAAGAEGPRGEDHEPETHIIPNVFRAALGSGPELKVFGKDYPTPDGTCVRDYVHISDLAVAHEKALGFLRQRRSEKFNLGNGNGFSVLDVIETAGKVVGKPIPYSVTPRREGDPAVLVAGSDKARKALGWEPRYASLEGILKSAWEWHREHPGGYESD